MPPTLGIRRVVFAHGLPVEAVPGDLLFQNPDSPCVVYLRVEQGRGRDAVAFYPPAVDLHEAHIEIFSGAASGFDNGFGFLTGGRVVILARHIDGKGVQAGFLPGNGLDEPGRGRAVCGRCRHGWRQRKRQRHENCFKHRMPL